MELQKFNQLLISKFTQISKENCRLILEIGQRYKEIQIYAQLFDSGKFSFQQKVLLANTYNLAVRNFVQDYGYLGLHKDLIILEVR